MACENPTWGEERIANELKVKLGIQVSPPDGRQISQATGGQTVETRSSAGASFVRNQANVIVACDFFVSVSLTFRFCTHAVGDLAVSAITKSLQSCCLGARNTSGVRNWSVVSLPGYEDTLHRKSIPDWSRDGERVRGVIASVADIENSVAIGTLNCLNAERPSEYSIGYAIEELIGANNLRYA
jgi:hypothetical protein